MALYASSDDYWTNPPTEKVSGPVAITITVPVNEGASMLGCGMLVVDHLASRGLIDGESAPQSIHIRRSESVAGMSVLVVSTKSKQEVA